MTLAEADAVYFGSTLADAVYLGDTLIWPSGPPPTWGPNESIFDASPPTGTSPQGAPFTFGIRFTPVVDGRITGVRFYSYFAGTSRPVSIWSDTGVKLAHGTGGVEVATGWQVIPLDTPLSVRAGVPLITSYGWTNSWNVFGYTAAAAVSVSPNLIAYKGSYFQGDMDSFPATDGGQHYYADVIFQEGTVAPPPFTPLDVPDLVVWLDAAQLGGYGDGDTVTTWPDSSGHAASATTVAGTAIYRTDGINGHPAMRFGERGFTEMKVVHSRTIGDRTIFQLLRTAGPPFGTWHTTQLQELDPYMQTYGGATIHTYTNPDLDSGVAWSGTAQVITLWATSSPAGQGLEVDGQQHTAGWVPGASSSPLSVGGFQPGGYASNTYIGELLIYERSLTPTERDDVHNYLRTKWGLP